MTTLNRVHRSNGLATVATAVFGLALCASPATAQAAAQGTPPVVFAPLAIAWEIGSVVAAYLLALLLSAVFTKAAYPPAGARLACWLALAAWALFAGLVLFPHVVGVRLSPLAIVVLAVVVVAAGMLLRSGARREA